MDNDAVFKMVAGISDAAKKAHSHAEEVRGTALKSQELANEIIARLEQSIERTEKIITELRR